MKMLHLLKDAKRDVKLKPGDYVIHIGSLDIFFEHGGSIGKIKRIHSSDRVIVDWLDDSNYLIENWPVSFLAHIEPPTEEEIILAILVNI